MEWGKREGYFDSEEDASAFYDELCYMLAHQMAAPEQPAVVQHGALRGLRDRGPGPGTLLRRPGHRRGDEVRVAYERPQPHACFILDIEDDLVNEGGIMDLVTREARLFKYGSGTGSNFSKIRGLREGLSGGGVSSGLLSFLKIADRSGERD